MVSGLTAPAAIGAALTLGASPGQAFELQRSQAGAPLKWPAAPVGFAVGDAPAGAGGDAALAVRKAFARWEAVRWSALRVEYLGRRATGLLGDAASEPGAVLVRWIAPWPDELGDRDLVVGLTRVDYDPATGAIHAARVALNGERFAWSTDGASVTVDIEAVALHEGGHALGLGHPCGDNGGAWPSCGAIPAGPERDRIEAAVMYPGGAFTARRRALGVDDADGLTALYPAGAEEIAPAPVNALRLEACGPSLLVEDPSGAAVARVTLEPGGATSTAVRPAASGYAADFAALSAGPQILVAQAANGKRGLAAVTVPDCPPEDDPAGCMGCSGAGETAPLAVLALVAFLHRRRA